MLNDILNYLNVTSFKEAEERYHFQKEYCNSCATLDETKGAESYDVVISRVMKTLEEICIENSNNGGGNVLIVAHGGILRLIIDYLDKSFDIRNIDNSSVSKVIFENGNFKVESVNDNSYSERGKLIKSLGGDKIENFNNI